MRGNNYGLMQEPALKPFFRAFIYNRLTQSIFVRCGAAIQMQFSLLILLYVQYLNHMRRSALKMFLRIGDTEV